MWTLKMVTIMINWTFLCFDIHTSKQMHKHKSTLISGEKNLLSFAATVFF